eukprot:TRINITY_DN24793_c0_g1_i1.p2 TRINITY_DN24793_c0_g1~~TRINITY_DN24793_c0_g1_i1.p2  ORF type:complete len:220 (-),score=-21.76 TRINITY_DN24793_c0_g1_i1:19-678(-)
MSSTSGSSKAVHSSGFGGKKKVVVDASKAPVARAAPGSKERADFEPVKRRTELRASQDHQVHVPLKQSKMGTSGVFEEEEFSGAVELVEAEWEVGDLPLVGSDEAAHMFHPAGSPSGLSAHLSSSCVVFRVTCAGTQPGDSLAVCGEAPELGAWNPFRAAALSTTPDTYPLWSATIELDARAPRAYKLIVQRMTGQVQWEQGPNRSAIGPVQRVEFRYE